MARLNQQGAPARQPKGQRPDPHNEAMKDAYAEGLATYAGRCPDGTPALYTAKQRAAARKAKAVAEHGTNRRCTRCGVDLDHTWDRATVHVDSRAGVTCV